MRLAKYPVKVNLTKGLVLKRTDFSWWIAQRNYSENDVEIYKTGIKFLFKVGEKHHTTAIP